MTEALSLRKAHLPLKISQEQELILTLDECSSHRNTSEVKGALGWWTKKASSFAKNEAKPPGHFKPHCLYMDIMSIKSILLTGYCSVWQAGNLMSKPPPTSCSMFECFGSDTFTPLQAFVLPARHCLCFWCITSYFLFFSQLDLNPNTVVKLKSGQVCFLSCQSSWMHDCTLVNLENVVCPPPSSTLSLRRTVSTITTSCS